MLNLARRLAKLEAIHAVALLPDDPRLWRNEDFITYFASLSAGVLAELNAMIDEELDEWEAQNV